MSDIRKKYIAIFGENIFGCLELILLGWVKNLKLLITPSNISSRVINILSRMPFVKKYIKEAIKECKDGLSDYKGLWYKVNEEAVELTLKFYNQKIKTNSLFIWCAPIYISSSR